MTDCAYRTQERTRRISLAVQWPRLHAANAGGAGWVLGQGPGSHMRACKVTSVVSHSLWHYRLFQAPVHGILQARILEWVAILVFLLQGILPTQGSNLCLLHWQVGSLPLCPNMLGKPQHAATKTCHSQINKQIINRERGKKKISIPGKLELLSSLSASFNFGGPTYSSKVGCFLPSTYVP